MWLYMRGIYIEVWGLVSDVVGMSTAMTLSLVF